MTTPMETLLNQVKWRCTICGGNMGCECWVTLRCPQCKSERRTSKDESDPKGTAVVRCLCPPCAKGDFSMIEYFDKDGKQLLPDAAHEPSTGEKK